MIRDLRGKVFGRLKVIEFYGQSDHRHKSIWLCKCSCGALTAVLANSLICKRTNSCGCLLKEAATLRLKGRFGKDAYGYKHGRSRDPLFIKAHWRKFYLKKYYGISPEFFRNMLEKQGNKCKICGNRFKRTPDIDHEHTTGKIRGLLCNNCNQGLGKFKDSIYLLQEAAKYLIDRTIHA
jgi:hypothetical protein